MVEGMEKIIATVSGYHGSERSKLIKLIAAAGANYVGKMSRSTTHLVCWKFKGEKYELAKKFGTKLVNHRWFEDCIREGKIIAENHYALISGQDAGFIMSNYSAFVKQACPLKENKLLLNKRSIHEYLNDVIDLDSDEIENDDFDVDLLLDENLFPKSGTITSGRQRSKRTLVKETSQGNRKGKADSMRSTYEAVVHTVDTFQSEESDYLPKCSNKQMRDPDMRTGNDLDGSSRRSRRLVKKSSKSATAQLATNGTELQSRTHANSNDQPASSLSNDSNKLTKEIEQNISGGHVRSSFAHTKNRHEMNQMNDMGPPGETGVQSEYIPDADGRNMDAISLNYQNLEGQCEHKDLPDSFSRVRKSVELSCVICWTDFSSSRGILPCGHRFCFSCIQNWADHMASNRIETTCPLCKMSFASITRVDGTASLDQKIYSQTVPCASSSQDIFFVPEAGPIGRNTQMPLPSACCHCQSPYPVDLLIYCQICQSSCIHSYCLDPPLFPWTCISCRDRRLFYQF